MFEFPALPYPWQQGDWEQYLIRLSRGKMPHAIMLAGPAGIGKRHFALGLAQYLLCLSPSGDAPCGNCRACLLNQAGTHPDLLTIFPEEDSKSIKVDQVRVLTESLSKTAQQGGYKVVVLAPAEAMNANASNALLKSLEEPADKTLLILISHAPFSVLPTIRSRCQLQLMAMPRREQVLHWIKPLLGGNAVAPDLLIDIARGAPLSALALLKDDALEQREQWQAQLGRLTLSQVSAIELAAQWQNADISAILEWLAGLLHSIARWQQGHQDALATRLDVEVRERLLGIPCDILQRYLEKLLLVRKQWTSGGNPNKQLMLEELLMDWSAMVRVSRAGKAGAGQLR